MSSPAASIAALCRDGVRALEEERHEAFDEVMSLLGEIGRPERAGTREEIEEALAETERLQAAVHAASDRVSEELGRVRRGRRALDGYEEKPEKAPRAVDLSA